MHIMQYFDREYLHACDLQGAARDLTISRVASGTIVSEGGRKTRKPVVFFEAREGREAPKGLALNKTNSKTIASLYGADTAAWIGKRVTLYPTTTTFGKEEVECIRVRPVAPKEQGAQRRPADGAGERQGEPAPRPPAPEGTP